MPQGPLESVLHYLRHVAELKASRDLSDAELLRRFSTQRDEASFTLLVQRHGPMVLGVCRRVLGDLHDAEDAFQATFLLLSSKSASIQKHASLAAWLHGVAQRVSLNARRRRMRRAERERRFIVKAHTEPVDAQTWEELRLVLDEELGQLPEKFRAPVVLCYFEGKTNEQAARELNCPKSSLSWRLGRAREMLRERLMQRGIALSTGTVAVVLLEPEKRKPDRLGNFSHHHIIDIGSIVGSNAYVSPNANSNQPSSGAQPGGHVEKLRGRFLPVCF
jgi:RNA polymerase sigma factor (sigma-70 family)